MSSLAERIFSKLDGTIGKAEYLSESIIERYDLDKGEIEGQDEALKFAYCRRELGMDMDILDDYIHSIRQSIRELENAVNV